MKVCGIIAEYNPFHTGHLFHLEQARQFADRIVIVMSGHITQRGELAKYDKWSRAEAALRCGADLVLELPVAFSCASAERFAEGGVHILQQLGCVDVISFGSESGDIQALRQTAGLCAQVNQSQQMKRLLKQGLSYPRARELALGEFGKLVRSPNNILGIEYIKAALKLNASFEFHTIHRLGAGYSGAPSGGTANAQYLRRHPEAMKQYLPKSTLHLYTQSAQLPASVALYQLRKMNSGDFAQLPDVTEGLEHRLQRAAQQAASLNQFFALAKTKRYTLSRLRRIVMYALLGLRANRLPALPQYARVLGFTPKGRQLLAHSRKNIRMLLSPDFPNIYKSFPNAALFDVRATDLFYLCSNPPQPCGRDFIHGPILLQP